MYHIFFFQAEDGIRGRDVTGVQTCALPILVESLRAIFGDRVPMKPEWVITLQIAAAVRSTPAETQETPKVPKSMTAA